MKRYLYLTLLAVTVVALVGVMPTMAQTSVDSETLDAVQAALTNTQAVSSMTVSVQSQTTRDGQTDATPTQQQTSSYQLATTSTGWNISGTETSTRTLPATDGSTATTTNTTMEFVVVDGVTYIRFTALPDTANGQNLPQDWVNADTLNRMPGGRIFGNLPSDGSLPSSVGAGLSLPLNATSVTAATELASDTIDDQTMRVFQFTLDPASLTGSAAGLINIGLGGGLGGLPGVNGQMPPSDGSGAPPAMGDGQQPPGNGAGAPPNPGNGQQPPDMGNGQPPMGMISAENAQVVVMVWVGADNFVHRISSAVTLTPMGNAPDGSAITGSTTTTTVDYTGFNQPISIAAPQVTGS